METVIIDKHVFQTCKYLLNLACRLDKKAGDYFVMSGYFVTAHTKDLKAL